MNDQKVSSVELVIPFADIDALRVVWHGHYPKYIELARSALLANHHLDVFEIEKIGIGLMVYEQHCRHTFPLFYNDRVRIDAWFKCIGVRTEIHYRIRNLSHDRGAARASTSLVFVDKQGRMLEELPHEICRRLDL